MSDSEILKYYESLLEYERLEKNILLTDDGVKEFNERIERHTRIVELLKKEIIINDNY